MIQLLGLPLTKKARQKILIVELYFCIMNHYQTSFFHSVQIRTSHQSYLEIKASFSVNIQTMLQTIRVIVILRRLLFKYDCYIYDIFLTAIA